MEIDEEQSKKEFEELAKKVQDFTTVLNKYNMEYIVKAWPNLGGYSINVDDCSIEFDILGAISFRVNAEIEDE